MEMIQIKCSYPYSLEECVIISPYGFGFKCGDYECEKWVMILHSYM